MQLAREQDSIWTQKEHVEGAEVGLKKAQSNSSGKQRKPMRMKEWSLAPRESVILF